MASSAGLGQNEIHVAETNVQTSCFVVRYALFVDFEKAFDRVNRAALWQKLLSQNVSSKMVNMLKAIYSDVKSLCKVNGYDYLSYWRKARVYYFSNIV